MASFPFLVLIPVAFWLLLVSPQRRKIRAQQALVSSLAPGAEVITSGGIIGTIVELDDREVSLEVCPGTVLRVARVSIVGTAASRGFGATTATSDVGVDDAVEDAG